MEDEESPHVFFASWTTVQFPALDIRITDDHALFHLSYDRTSKKVTVFHTETITTKAIIEDLCANAATMDLSGDPFVFLTSSLSRILMEWGRSSQEYYSKLRIVVRALM